MKIKKLTINIAVVALILAGGLPLTAVADEVVEVNMRFAGAFATGISHAEPVTGFAVTSALVDVQAKGSLGSARIRGFGGRSTDPSFHLGPDCLGAVGPFFSFTITENPLVFSFNDLSLLFAKGGSGLVCIDLLHPGVTTFEINIAFMGGKGRFEGATGFAVLKGEGESVSADGSFIGETGTIEGWISAPFHKNKHTDDD